MAEDNNFIPDDSELEFIKQEQDIALFNQGYDKPIDNKFLHNYIGGRQMGYGDDELKIIEDTAFSKIMDYMDANDIHYSDIDVYDFIPEDKRLTPYLIFELGQRNEYYTNDLVEYMISVTRRTPSGIYDFDLDEIIDAPPSHYMAEYALKGADAQGPEQKLITQAKIISGEFTEGDLKKLKFKEFFEKVSITANAKDVKIKFVNNLFPGGSYEAYLEEGQRRAMEKMGMTPEGDWLPEVKENMIIKHTDVDGKVTYKDFYGKEVSPDDPRISDDSKFDDLVKDLQTPPEELTEEQQIKKLYDDGIITETEYKQALNKEGNWADTPTNVVDDASELDEFAFKDSIAYKRSKTIKESINEDLVNRRAANNIIDLYTEYDSFVLENKLTFKEQELLLSYVNSEVMNVSGELGKLQSKPDVDLSSEEIEKLDDILDTAKKDFKGKLEIELSSIKGVPDNISELADTPTNVVDDGPALLETRMKIKTQDPEDFGVPGDEIDERVIGWDDDVVKPNKIFAPSKMETNRNYIAQGQKFPSGEDVLNAIKAGTATDEDITRFFIYVASKSPNTIYAGKPMNNADAIADIAKIGIFGDIPIKDLIPLGGKDPYLESEFNLVLDNNQTLSSYDRTIILDMVNEKGQFANLKERMRNVLLDAHNKIYTENANDYFILWRGGNLSRFNTWQSFSKQPETAAMISYQINMSGVGQGGGLNAYVINKNNMIDLDSLGLAHGQEKEIIVLTEAANKPGAKLANSLEKAEELRNYQDSWELRKTIPEFVDTFPKEGFVVENISTQLNQLGQDTQNFFNDLISGMNPDLRPNKPYEQIIELNNSQLQNAQDIYNKYVAQGGDFNPHYFTSIPTVYETQIVKAQALSNMLDKHDKVINDTGTIKVLDIGGTEGVWGNTLAEIGDEKIYVEIIDPSPVANNLYNKMQTPVNSRFRHEAFSYVIEDQGRFFNDRKMIRFAEFFAGGTKDNTTGLRNPNVQVQGGKYDVVHEAMAFQFVDKNRQAQIDFIADYVLADDGILLIEEKFTNNDVIYQNNEKMKDDFKRLYYTEEQINSKYQNIVGPMGDKQVSVQEIENILGNRFKYVNQYWDSGNFKGYIASNNPIAETFVDEIHLLDTSLTNHRFSTAPTQEELKFAVQKDMRNRGIDIELAKDFAKRFVDGNKQFIQSASDALGEVYKVGKAVAPAVGSLAIRGLSKAAPVLAPGDVLVEGALSKVTPYVDDFAKRLGFASLPAASVINTYVAADVAAAGAEIVSAAMYAYDESQRNAPQQPSQFQESLTKFLLPKAYEEEAVQKLQIPQDLESFYRTPAGQQFLEDNDFGSLFKKQLEQEKLTKYSPGWQLSKAIFSLFGSMSREQANISEKTRGNMGQALLTGIGK